MDTDQLTLTMVMDRGRSVFGNRRIITRRGGQDEATTYADFYARVDRLAWALRELGVSEGDRVATMAWNHQRHLELYMAVTCSGAVLHTVNIRLSPAQAAEVCAHADDRVIFADTSLSDLADAAAESLDGVAVVRMGVTGDDPRDEYEALLARQPDGPFAYPGLSERQPAATSYSSATTGSPKGVVYSHRALVLHSMMLAMTDTWGISESDRILPVVPMFHVNAWGLPFAGLWMGSGLVLPGERPAAATVLDLLRAHDVTVTAAVPTVWADVFRSCGHTGVRLPALRLLVSGGAPLSRALLEQADQLGIPLVHAYGMTEASPLVLVGQMRSDAPTDPEANARLRLRQGYVVPGLRYRVLDADGKEVPHDGSSPGELQLRGPWVAEEYERDPRSAAAFKDGWYRTGDIVTVDPAEYLQVVDRASDMIKSGGEWISSVELENALAEHPGVLSAAVVGVPDNRWQERPRAYVVAKDAVTAEDLLRHLGERFPRFWLPDEIRFIDAIPLTSVGKFDKKALRATAGDSPSAVT